MNVKNTALEEVLTKYQKTKHLAEEDLSGWDHRTVNGKISAKRAAQDELAKVEQQYNDLLRSVTGIVCVHGGTQESQAEFLKHVDALGNVPVYSTNELYSLLSASVDANLSKNREITAHSVMTLTSEMTNLGKKLNLNSLLPPRLTSAVMCPTLQDTIKNVRQLIRSTSADELAVPYFSQKIIKDAFDREFNKPVLSVVIMCADSNEAFGLAAHTLNPSTNKIMDLSKVNVSFGFVEDFFAATKKVVKASKQKE